jgi:photosystem II stability/assembly factor-like uncharacterized protein
MEWFLMQTDENLTRDMKQFVSSVLTAGIAVALWLVITLSSCQRDPYEDNGEVMTPVIPGWEITSRQHNLGANMRKMYFVTPAKGYVIGYNGYLMHTSDSGKTWTALNPGTDLHLESISFLDENNGFIAGKGGTDCLNEDCGKGSFLLRTSDGGDTWTKIFYDTLAFPESMIWYDANNALALLEYRLPSQTLVRQPARTVDGGNTWTLINTNSGIRYTSSLVNAGDAVYIAGSDGVIRSTDRGATWQVLPTPVHQTNGWYRIYFRNSNHGFIADNAGVYSTISGGNTWQRTDGALLYFDGMHFTDAFEGFCFNVVTQYQGGDFPQLLGSYVFSTDDGGNTWNQSELYKGFYSGNLTFPSDEIGYGINGVWFHTYRRKRTN